jgi:hypothetical protein
MPATMLKASYIAKLKHNRNKLIDEARTAKDIAEFRWLVNRITLIEEEIEGLTGQHLSHKWLSQ